MLVKSVYVFLVLVVHGTFEPQAGEVLEDEVVVLGDAAEGTQSEALSPSVVSLRPHRGGRGSPESGRDSGGSTGLGCIRMKGSSTDTSLERKQQQQHAVTSSAGSRHSAHFLFASSEPTAGSHSREVFIL
ncbi:hypothetical protein EYF80_043821 [Liparis tanakae]|uniref:Secreted protein n=1 Tax=Liparis tanakae TaxID=230148 RepID=A0A4Z2G0C9_9TELE|nr:hypothetical protein EYF80_043821 [Liparis tanakae]